MNIEFCLWYFVDYAKVFDKVWHNELCELLGNLHLFVNDIRIIENLYWERNCLHMDRKWVIKYTKIESFLTRHIQPLHCGGPEKTNSRNLKIFRWHSFGKRKETAGICSVVSKGKWEGLNINYKKTMYNCRQKKRLEMWTLNWRHPKSCKHENLNI